MREECKKEKINGTEYIVSSSDYRHSIVNGNIYSIIKSGLKGSLCLTFMENLDYKKQAQENDDYVSRKTFIRMPELKSTGLCRRKNVRLRFTILKTESMN